MRRLRWGAVVLVVLVLAGAGWFFAYRRAPTSAFAPESFPCLDSPSAGWLTAQSDRGLVRIEWDPDGGQFGVSPGTDPVTWQPKSEAEARAIARSIVEPLADPRSASEEAPAEVTVLVACEESRTLWDGRTERPYSYRICLRLFSRPEPEDSRVPLSVRVSDAVQCLEEVHTSRARPLDLRASSVVDRMDRAASASGLVLAPRDAPMFGEDTNY